MAGAGYFRQVLTVQNPVTTVDAYGQGSEAWVTTGLIRGHLEQVASAEPIGDAGPVMRQEFSIEATWAPNVTSRSRLVWNDNGLSRTLNLRSCHDVDSRRKRLRIQAVEELL
jgi:head-tail adaptor